MRAILTTFRKGLLLLSLFFFNFSYTQQLLETREGDPLYSPILSSSGLSISRSTAIFKVNVVEQSLGGEFYKRLAHTITNPRTSNKYWIINAGIKAKPTEGYASVFKNGQFSPGVNFSIATTYFKVFDANNSKTLTQRYDDFTDWGGFYLNFNVNKYQLYKSDTTFTNQLYSKTFNGGEIGLNYNMLFRSQYLLSAKIGYARKSNFSDLDETQIEDIKSEYDTISKTTRNIKTTKTARLGSKYAEFDALNLKIAFTRLTQGGAGSSLSIGYSGYIDIKGSSIARPTANIGVILFLSKLKDYISTPLIGFDFQFVDITDSKKAGNSLFRRFSLGITSVIPILQK